MNKKKQWVLDYLANNMGASAVDTDFHDEFHERFGGARVEKMWGACPVHAAQRILSQLFKEGLIERIKICLGDSHVGMPNWVYSYYLEKE